MRWTNLIKRVFIFLILLAPLGFLFPFVNDFPYLGGSNYSDMVISHYPNAIFLLNSLREWHQLPLWSNTILSGYPFAADPLAGLWYLPGWLAYLFPLPLGFNLDILLHIVWGGLGTFLFLQKGQRSLYASLAGTLIFELSAKAFAHYGAGHVSLLYAVAWTPWLFYAEKYFLRSTKVLLVAAVLGMAALADVRWFAFLLLAWVYYACYGWLDQKKERLERLVGRLLLSTALAVLIAAVLLVPLWEFSRLSTRADLTPTDNLALSLPVNYLVNLVVPNFNASAEWVVYPGGAALILVLFSLSIAELRKKNGVWIGLMIVVILIALGAATPVGSLLFQLPGFDLLRVPSRILFLLAWGFAIVAADCVDFLFTRKGSSERRKQPGNGLLIVGLSGFMFLVSAGLWFFTKQVGISFIWGTIVTACTTLLVLLRRSGRLSTRNWGFAMLTLISLDLGGVDYLNLRFKPASEVLAEGGEAARWLGVQPDIPFRVYSPSYSIPQQSAVTAGLQLADGIDPLQLQSYVTYMGKADGVGVEGYSVTMPPFTTGSPEVDNLGKVPDMFSLGQLNVRYLVSAFPVTAPRLELINRTSGTWIYENSLYRPRAWVQGVINPESDGYLPVDQLSWSPNKIEVHTSQPGLLVLSELNYPGWRATIDGSPVPVIGFDGLLRSVVLPSGQHMVDFVFEPVSVYAGLGLSLLGWIVVGAGLYFGRKRGW